MEDHLTQIAQRTKKWREAAGMTLKELGNRAGVSASTLAFTMPREHGNNLSRRLIEVWEKAMADQVLAEQIQRVARA